MNKQEQIKEMGQIICERSKDGICLLDKTSCDGICGWTMQAETIYNAGYRKVLLDTENGEEVDCVQYAPWQLIKGHTEREVEKARKETAKEILEFIDDKLKDYNSKYLIEIKPYIQAKYNIGITCKQIKDYENYFITTDGVVINKQTNEVKQQFVNRKGYLVVTLYKNNEPKNISVHRLVATAFIDNPNNYPEVNHINGIKTDNRVGNLEWCSSKENSLHRTVVLGKGNIKPVKCIETGIIYNSGLEASKITKASSGGISKSCRDKTGSAIAGGYHWRYLTSFEVEE